MRESIWSYLLSLPGKQIAYQQLKFLGEYKPENNKKQLLINDNCSSLKHEVLNWKSKWNISSQK